MKNRSLKKSLAFFLCIVTLKLSHKYLLLHFMLGPQQNIPSTAISYTLLETPPTGQLTEDKIKELVILTQGEAVEILDTPYIESAMKLFHFVQKYSSECIYKTMEGNRIMIFDHQAIPVIRDMNIISPYTLHDPEPISQTTAHLSIDIENLWDRTNGNEIDKTKQLLDLLRQLPAIGEETTLIGKVPVIAVLFAQYFVSHLAKRLYYQESRATEKILIY